MRCMRLADDVGIRDQLRAFLESQFRDLALHMRNQ